MSTGSIEGRGRRKEAVGKVISDKMNKTISVQIFRLVKHPMYNKFIRSSSVFKAHDEKNEAKIGDKVVIYESRPLSKTKRWTLGEVLEKAKIQEGANV
jgi:small subunit ribosomal protein S17